MPKNTYPDCKDAVIEMLIGILVDVSAIAEAAHEYASRESEYAGSLVPYSLAVIQNSADQASPPAPIARYQHDETEHPPEAGTPTGQHMAGNTTGL